MRLQQLAYARILCEFHRLRRVPGEASLPDPASAGAWARLAECEQRWSHSRGGLDEADFGVVRIARALYLQRMLESAPARLAPWSDCSSLRAMPSSHLFEWVAHDCERLELSQLEDAMSPTEAALYAHSLDQLQG